MGNRSRSCGKLIPFEARLNTIVIFHDDSWHFINSLKKNLALKPFFNNLIIFLFLETSTHKIKLLICLLKIFLKHSSDTRFHSFPNISFSNIYHNAYVIYNNDLRVTQKQLEKKKYKIKKLTLPSSLTLLKTPTLLNFYFDCFFFSSVAILIPPPQKKNVLFVRFWKTWP